MRVRAGRVPPRTAHAPAAWRRERLRYRRVSKSLREGPRRSKETNVAPAAVATMIPMRSSPSHTGSRATSPASDGCERIGTRAGDHVDGDDLVFRGGGSTDLLESLPERSKGDFVEDPPYLLGSQGLSRICSVGVDGHVLDEPYRSRLRNTCSRCGQALPQLGRLFFQVVVDTRGSRTWRRGAMRSSPHPGTPGRLSDESPRNAA